MHNEIQNQDQTVEPPVPLPKRVPFAAVSEHTHLQADGIYVKGTFVRKDVRFFSKKFPVDHVIILAHGELLSTFGDKKTHYRAPASYVIPANSRIEAFSLTDVVYYCVHATDEKDLETLKQIY